MAAHQGDETSVRCGNRLSSDQRVDNVIDRGEKEKTSSVDLLRLTDRNNRGFPPLSLPHTRLEGKVRRASTTGIGKAKR